LYELTIVATVCSGPRRYRVASSGSGYMKIRLASGAHDQRNMLQPPASRNTPISAGTKVYMSIVTMR